MIVGFCFRASQAARNGYSHLSNVHPNPTRTTGTFPGNISFRGRPLRMRAVMITQSKSSVSRRGLPRKDMLPGKVPVVRVGFGCTFDKWLYPFLAAWEARKNDDTRFHE
jgi:hypothetical protein